MNIIGISGLENEMPFKKSHWPGLEEREYRISQGYDSAAAIVVDGEVVAAVAEERFTGKKHTGAFPTHAIQYCLHEASLTLDDIAEIAHGFDYAPYRAIYALDPTTRRQYDEVFSKEALLNLVRRELPEYPAERVVQVSHHLAHAASAFHTSGWEDCLVVVIDGMGEMHSASVYHGRGSNLELIAQVSAQDSIGILYSLVTLHLGFDFNSDEYKIMGLAPYGDPAKYRGFFEEVVHFEEDGTFRIPILQLNKSREERETYAATRKYLEDNLISARSPDAEITDRHRDVSAALQECLDKTMLHLCGQFGRQLGLRKLALAGGVALNCTANGKLLRSGLFDDIYVQPAAGDDGVAVGAALHRSMQLGSKPVVKRMAPPYLGPGYSTDDLKRALQEFEDRIDVKSFTSLEETCREAAKRVADGEVLAWFRGRMEFGPRALGNRSIIADPGHPEMRDRINAMVKKREGFRPFAPAVSLEEASRWFDIEDDTELPYMVMIVDVREEHRQSLPAITHVNGSARVQTVSKIHNVDFHRLLQEVGRTTGREMVLNTSFNVKGQPMVNTPREALNTFLGTGIDCLLLGDFLVTRRDA